jgi:hypothetical protein
MTNYSQHLTTAIAAMAKNAMAGAPISPGINPGRPRSVSDILDVRNTFVAGYPQHVERTKHDDGSAS